ncbi:MAG: hypothetical protein ABEK42_04825 [Thiohalorhabdaceae bacterium]
MPALHATKPCIDRLMEAYQHTRLGEAFRKDPHGVLAHHGQEDDLEILAAGYRPLLPDQARVRRRLDAEWCSDSGSGNPNQPSPRALQKG